MTHQEFVSRYRAGAIKVNFNAPLAARLLSAKLLLPVMTLPVLGIGVGLALIGWLWTGLIIIAIGFIGPRMIKRSAPHFLLTQALQDAELYEEVCKLGILQIVTVTHETPRP